MPKTNTVTIDLGVLSDARRMLETAARRLAAIERQPDDEHDENKTRMSEALANIRAALARLE
jgi:uncharacterized membrane protein YccC